MSRNRIWPIALLMIALVLPACGGEQVPTATPVAANATAPTTGRGGPAGTLNGVTLPADAAPPDQQVYIVHYDNTADFTTIDFFESVYKRGGAVADILSDALVRLDKNFQIHPGAATKWDVDKSG